MKFNYRDLYNSKIHPKISKAPPIGVTGPKNQNLIFSIDCSDKKNILKEKRNVPLTKNLATHFFSSIGNIDKTNSAIP